MVQTTLVIELEESREYFSREIKDTKGAPITSATIR